MLMLDGLLVALTGTGAGAAGPASAAPASAPAAVGIGGGPATARGLSAAASWGLTPTMALEVTISSRGDSPSSIGGWPPLPSPLGDWCMLTVSRGSGAAGKRWRRLLTVGFPTAEPAGAPEGDD